MFGNVVRISNIWGVCNVLCGILGWLTMNKSSTHLQSASVLSVGAAQICKAAIFSGTAFSSLNVSSSSLHSGQKLYWTALT